MESRNWSGLPRAARAVLLLAALAPAIVVGQQEVRYSADYEIQDDLQVRERLTIGFLQPSEEALFRLGLPTEVADLRVTNGSASLKFQTTAESGGSLVSVTVPAGSRELRASFTTREPLFSRGGELRFFTTLRAPGGAERVDVSVTLPAGASLLRERVLPANATVGSDGQRTTLRWSLARPSGEVTLSVPFVPPASRFQWLHALAGGLGAASGALFLLYFRRRVNEERLRGFSEDEQKVLQFLKSRKEVYQEDVIEAFGFSMAKVSRMVKRFEASGLVGKEKIGRSNRLTWKPALGARLTPGGGAPPPLRSGPPLPPKKIEKD